MFTGIIEEIGYIEDINVTRGSGNLAVRGELVCQDCHLGDSIAVNGVCLTVTDISASSLRFDVSAETLERSIFCPLADTPFTSLQLRRLVHSAFIISGRPGWKSPNPALSGLVVLNMEFCTGPCTYI